MTADNIDIAGDPHHGAAVQGAGARLEGARSAVIMLHGRGATAESILSLAAEFRVPGVAYLAPQAVGHAWYPLSFLAPPSQNEPYLSSALATVGRTVARAEAAGVPVERIFLLGFSQGACLASEWVARNPRRYGGLFALSGGLIGDTLDATAYDGSLAGTPAFLGCSDVDAHIPASRVEETGRILAGMGAAVDVRLYPGMAHTVNAEEIAVVAGILEAA
jgi:predicted esterase